MSRLPMNPKSVHPTVSRREFLKYTGGFAAVTPTILHATDKSGSRRPIVGAGAHTYEVHHDWGTLPGDLKYGNTHGVCEDSQGRIYVHHTVGGEGGRRDSIVVFDAAGTFVKSWGSEYEGGAHGLHVSREGRDEYLYLCDTKRAVVVKTTLEGEVVLSLGYPQESPQYAVGPDGQPRIKYSPTNVAIAPNGDIYVGDGYGSSYINHYNRKGEFIRTFGGKGKDPGQLDCPHGLIVDTRHDPPTLLVADRGNRRLQVFSLDGRHVRFVEGTNHPCHFDERNGLMVIPDLWARVTLIDRQNAVIAHLGEAPIDSWKPLRTGPRENFPAGKFICPHGACFDHQGNIFVVEWVEVGRVTKLRKID